MLTEKKFRAEIENMPKAIPSKTGKASYTSFKSDGDILHFTRVRTKKRWRLDMKLLYKIYTTNKFINTSVVKSIGKGRVNSPSVAVLMAIGCLDADGNRIK